MFKPFYLVLFSLLLISFNYCSAQDIDKNKFHAIFSINDNYNLHAEDIPPGTYGDVYLITSNQAIDSTMLSFSKKLYYSQRSIIDSLKTKFNIYIILRNKSKTNSSEIFDTLIDSNDYNRSYLFKLDGTYKMQGAIKEFNFLLRDAVNFKFTKADKKCDLAKSYCTVLIKKSY